jgi:hypothetical protein
MLPSSCNVCNILIKAGKTKEPLSDLKGVPVEILSAVYPDIYKSEFKEEKPENVTYSLPFGSELVLMASGGLGSTASLWKILSSGRDCKVLFVEGMYDKLLESTRKKFIKELMTEGRGNNGNPLADGSIEEGLQTWLDSVIAPVNAHLLPRKARIILLSILAYEKFQSAISLVWGATFDCLDVFRALIPWKIQHVLPFSTFDTALFSLSYGEIVTDTLKEKHGVTSRTISPGPMLVSQCLNHVCSCWDNPLDTNEKYQPRKEAIHKPFLAMCGKCNGCQRWLEAAELLYEKVPYIRFGTKESGADDDDHHWSTVSTLEICERRTHIPTEQPTTSARKTKGRPKKSKVESKQESDSEEEEEENKEKVL